MTLKQEIVKFMEKRGTAKSAEVHKFFSHKPANQISGALTNLFVVDKLLTRKKDGRGYIYSLVQQTKAPVELKVTGGPVASVIKKPRPAVTVRKVIITGETTPFQAMGVTKEDADTAWDNAALRRITNAAFEKHWASFGPFTSPYWKGVPKSEVIDAYMDSFKAPAYAAFVAGIQWHESNGNQPTEAQ